MLEMTLLLLGTNEFFPQLVCLVGMKGTGSPAVQPPEIGETLGLRLLRVLVIAGNW